MKILLTLLLIINLTSCGYMNEQELTVTIDDKERIVGNKSSYYLIFTDTGSFKISDQFFYWKFNSSDLYGGLKRKSKYKITTHGYRIPFLSSYPNIEKYQELR